MEKFSCFGDFITGRVSGKPYDFRNKPDVISDHITYMLLKTLSMFKYGGLPDTIPTRVIELYFQLNGSVGIYEYENNIYALFGSLGGEPNYNYMPTRFVFSNPALKISKELLIDKECVIIPNDDMYFGLYPLMNKYATALCENELSMYMTSIIMRAPSLVSAGDDTALTSAQKFFKDLEDGKFSAVGDSEFLEGIKSSPLSSAGQNRTITQLIEYEQYLRAGFFNEIGLNANYNMKRESLNSNESQLNDDMLYPMVDNMLKCRREGLEKVNAMYGTNITVEFNSSWWDNEKEKLLTLQNMSPDTSGEGNPDTKPEGGESDVLET